MTVICSDLIFHTRVTVDTSLLERAAQFSPALVVAFVLSLAGTGLAAHALPRGSRGWSLVGLCAPGVGLAVFFFVQAWTELPFPCALNTAALAAGWTASSAVIATLSLSQLIVVLTLRSWTKDPQAFWPTVVLSAALITSGAVGWQKRNLQHEFESRVNAVMPLPALSHTGKPLEAHLNHSVPFTGEIWAAGKESAWFVRERTNLLPSDRERWGLASLEFTPTEEGTHAIPVHRERDLVTIDDEIEVTGVRDEGPSWFPLSVGNRWEFVRVRGTYDFIDKLPNAIATGAKPMPDPTLVFEVIGEGEHDGLHFFEIKQSTVGETIPSLYRWVRRNGELFDGDEPVAFQNDGDCEFKLIEPSSCTCLEDRMAGCWNPRPFDRVSVAFLTFGLSEAGRALGRSFEELWYGKRRARELQRARDKEPEEERVLLMRWVVDGEERSLRGG